jgi:hypothetical protein
MPGKYISLQSILFCFSTKGSHSNIANIAILYSAHTPQSLPRPECLSTPPSPLLEHSSRYIFNPLLCKSQNILKGTEGQKLSLFSVLIENGKSIQQLLMMILGSLFQPIEMQHYIRDLIFFVYLPYLKNSLCVLSEYAK